MHRPGFVGRGPWGPRGPIVDPILGRDGDASLAVARGADAGFVARWRYSRAGVPTAALHRPSVGSRESLIDLNFGPDSSVGLAAGPGSDLGLVAGQVYLRAGVPLIWRGPIILIATL